MRVLVTGGAGYVGSTLVPMLLAAGGDRVRVVDALLHGGESLLGCVGHPAFEFVRGDLTEIGVVTRAVSGMDAVVHLAAIVGDPACARQPERARAVNLEASRALLEAARAAGVKRFIFASTCSNYGRMKDPSSYVDEASELAPVSLYAETKVAFERTLLAERGLCATPLRFATVYGVSPRMRFDLTVNEFTMEMLTKGRLVVFGEQFWRPYIHVRDAARALATVLAAEEGTVAGQVFNVGATAENYRKKDLVEMIRPHAPNAVIEFVHREEDPRDYRVSFERIRGDLGFRTTRTVAEGIAEVAGLVRSQVIADFGASRWRN
jgi:nucleoside-diphosphate-sugar epimerase